MSLFKNPELKTKALPAAGWTIVLLLPVLSYCHGANGGQQQAQAVVPKSAQPMKCVNPGSMARLVVGKAALSSDGSGAKVPAHSKAFTLNTAGWPPRPWPDNMVWIPSGQYAMGGVGELARSDEFPLHDVKVDGFWIDQTELTIGAFRKFVQATGYVTTAEKKPEWEQLKKQLPPGTPEPDPSVLVPGSMVFVPTSGPVPLNDYTQWWNYVSGANWRHPMGPGTDVFSTTRFDGYPVTQLSWFDAVAYCNWAGKRLPTEAEWEWAGRGGLKGKAFAWGDDPPTETNIRANLWEGAFPYRNDMTDGYQYVAPVKSYDPNGYGLYDMIGNVWEWCSDWYRADTYAAGKAHGLSINPKGPASSFDPDEPYAAKRVIRGGSFLCNESYCASYRPSARMKTDPYSGECNLGCRPVMSETQWLALSKILQNAQK